MSILSKVYDCGGECLGNEYADLSKLQEASKLAVMQIIYLDKAMALVMDHLPDKKEDT